MSLWNIVEDKSIEADHLTQKIEDDPFLKCELVSPKLEYNNDTLNKLELILENLREKMNANTNESCGFHIHFDAEDLSINDIISIACNYSFFEDIIDLFMEPTRRDNKNKYIQSIRTPIYNNIENLLNIFECEYYSKASLSILDMINPNRKCSKLNFVNYFYYNLGQIGLSSEAQNKYINTIENRHHHGSLDYIDMLHWIKFNLLFIHHSQHKPAFLLQNKIYNSYYIQNANDIDSDNYNVNEAEVYVDNIDLKLIE